MELDLTRNDTSASENGKGHMQVRVIPRLSSAAPVKGWTFDAFLKVAITTAEPELSLGEIVRQGKRAITKTVACNLVVPRTEIGGIQAEGDSPFAQFQVVDSKDQSCRVQLTIAPSLGAGDFNFPVALRVFSQSGESLSTARLQIKGSLAEEIQFVPPELQFGFAKIGSVKKERIVLRSSSGRPFTVKDVCASPGVEVRSKLPVAPGCQHTFDISVPVRQERDSEAVCSFVCIDADNVELKLRLKTGYFGIP